MRSGSTVLVCLAVAGCGGAKEPSGLDGSAITSVQARDAHMRFVADVVQLASGEIVAVGIDEDGRGAVHLVDDDSVEILHAGAPLGSPTGVDLDASGTILLTDSGGADVRESIPGPAEHEDEQPTGGLYTLSRGGGAPQLVTDAIVTPQGVAVAADGVVYVTGFTASLRSALFSVSGGSVATVAEGAPLVMPGDMAAIGAPDAVRLWIVDLSGAQDGVTHGGANVVVIDPAAGTMTEVARGWSATGVAGASARAFLTTSDPLGHSGFRLVDPSSNEGREIRIDGQDAPPTGAGAGAGADEAHPVLAGGSTGHVLVTL